MQNATPTPELVNLFDFIDSDTPSTVTWVINYLVKKRFLSVPQIHPHQAVSTQVANFVIGTYPGDIKEFARKMSNTYRVRKHRSNSDAKTLSVRLDKVTSSQLAQMSKGRKKSDVVTLLIQNNYQGFLAGEKERRTQLAEAKKQKEFQKQQKQLSKSMSVQLQANSQNECKTEEFRDGIAALYDIIFKANENGEKINDESLLLATKIYYAAFAK